MNGRNDRQKPVVAPFSRSMLHHFLLVIILSALSIATSYAQTADSIDTKNRKAFIAQIDSLIAEYEKIKKEEQIRSVIASYDSALLKREMSFHAGGAMFVARGLLTSWSDHHFITHDAIFDKKSTSYAWKDYAVAGMPLAVNWALKAAGVQSRSKTERMLTANAMSLAISFGTTQLLKHTIREGRPDQSDLYAFPSGHASLAFASATILSREYGHLSPWVTVGGYASATATQLLRMKHNRHWINDLYMGAGIGTLSTGLGYFLTDKLYGSQAIHHPHLRQRDVLCLSAFSERPSGLSFVTGTELGDRIITLSDARIRTGAALSAGIDMAWYLSPHVALTLSTRMVEAQAKVYDAPTLFTGGNLSFLHFGVGARYTFPLALGKHFGTHAFLGTRTIEGDSFSDGITTHTLRNETKPELGTGFHYEYLDTGNNVLGITVDYYHTFSSHLQNRFCIGTVWKVLF